MKMFYFQQQEYDEDDLQFFKNVVMEHWDVNHDGKINQDEFKMLLLSQTRLTSEAREQRNQFPMNFEGQK